LQNSGLPWMLPKKTFSLDLSGLTELFEDVSDLVFVWTET